jgi:hypothetical protein
VWVTTLYNSYLIYMLAKSASYQEEDEGDRKGPHATPLHPRPYNEYDRRVCVLCKTLLANSRREES